MKRFISAFIGLLLLIPCTSVMTVDAPKEAPRTIEVQAVYVPIHTAPPKADVPKEVVKPSEEVAEEPMEPYVAPVPVEQPHYFEEIPLSAELQNVLFAACERNGIEPAVALALIYTESRFNPYAVNSSSGCYGLCQLNPACFPSGLSPAENINYGMDYLGRQIRVYGTVEAGLTAYAVGHDNGSRYYASTVLAEASLWRPLLEGNA